MPVFIIIVLVIVISLISSNKKAAAARKKQEQNTAGAQNKTAVNAKEPAPVMKNGIWRCACGSFHSPNAAMCPYCGMENPMFKAAPDSSADTEYQTDIREEMSDSGSLGGNSEMSDYGSPEGYSSEGKSSSGSLEGSWSAGSMGEYISEGKRSGTGVAKPSLRHVVTPVTESAHSHTENGMTAAEPCLDSYSEPIHDAYEISSDEYGIEHPDISNREAIVRGIIWSEILGKPKSRRQC